MAQKAPTKREEWHQASPVDQLIVIRSAIEGHIFNIESGNRVLKQCDNIHGLLNHLEELEPFLRGDIPW